MIKTEVSPEVIETFLNGHDPQKYIVAIEAPYHENQVSLIINDPVHGKRIEKHSYKPFLWLKHDVTSKLYNGKRSDIMAGMKKYGIKIKALTISDSNGHIPARLERGYKFIATCNLTYNHLVNFFKDGGVDVFAKENQKMFMALAPAEQFLIQSGKRLFKGFDDYNDVHRFQFDLETKGLNASTDAIFQIGMRDNKGFELVLETKGDTEQEKRDSERTNIINFFKVIATLQPDIITAYNSENFDWTFFEKRCERLSLDITEIAKTLNPEIPFKRKASMIKLGGESEAYMQTQMWGFNILDISHAVRRAMAINSEIKRWSLKYITKYAGVAKPNRVYVAGDKIYTTWSDEVSVFAFNDTDGDWYKVTDKTPLKDGYKEVKGEYIVQRYLLDDLWETEQVDTIYNQAAFLLAKIIPTSYMRSSTMGTAGTWKLIMAAWSYENNLAIPDTEPKRDFTGGLSRLLEVGFAKNVGKCDYAALYPKTELTHDIFPDLDISGVMKGLLTYVVDTRDESKFLAGEHKSKAKKLSKKLEEDSSKMTPEEITALKTEIAEEKRLASLFDKKQLPLKILANSWFGAYGAPYIFPWGETDCAEETTCRGRQYLRLMVRHFTEKHGMRALVLDTDGVNFALPDSLENFKYTPRGDHWKTKEDAGIELTGLDAALAEFNEMYMIGRMGLDVDDICNSTINFARKNYANDIDGKIKLVGNTIKSKKMPTYIEEFLNKGIRLLLDGKGYEFIEYYYEHVDKIYNYQIPIAKIASKSKVKISVADYKKKANQKNKAGRPMPKQAHMELVINAGLELNLGDVVYYVNTGKSKSDGDIKSVKNKETGRIETKIFCKLIPTEQLENDPEYTTDEYNVVKYLDAFNKRITPLLVCFDREIRSKILITVKKERKTKANPFPTEKLEQRSFFTKAQCTLVAGQPDEPEDQDTYEELMTMEDKEIKFWMKVNKLPNNMEQEEWDAIQKEYTERLAKEKVEGVIREKEALYEVFKRMELQDFKDIAIYGTLPIAVLQIADLNDDDMLVSRKYDEPLYHGEVMLNFEESARQRAMYYDTLEGEYEADDKYNQWLDYMAEKAIMTGDTITVTTTETITEIVKPEIVEEQPLESTTVSQTEEEDEWNF